MSKDPRFYLDVFPDGFDRAETSVSGGYFYTKAAARSFAKHLAKSSAEMFVEIGDARSNWVEHIQPKRRRGQ